MIKDYRKNINIPNNVVITNNSQEDIAVRLKNIDILLNANSETEITLNSSEEHALLVKQLSDLGLENNISKPFIVNLPNSRTSVKINGTFSKLHFNKEVVVYKCSSSRDGYQAGQIEFSLNNKHHSCAWGHFTGASTGAPEIDYVTMMIMPLLEGMPTNRAGILYILKSEDDEKYVMELVDEKYADVVGVITDVKYAGTATGAPIQLGLLS